MRSPSDRIALRRLIEERLKGTRPGADPMAALSAGLSPEAAQQLQAYFPPSPTAAAVLVPLVDHPEGLSVLLTQRASHLKRHGGQVSFPGGRIEPGDDGPVAAALRETEEEIGLSRRHVTVVGYLDPQLVLTGYWVTPVVAFVQPGFELKLDECEVESAFEAPLAHILDPANHQVQERAIGSVSVPVYDIPYGPYRIWGATASMLMNLYRLVAQKDRSVSG
ncbi:MAG TPA: CoA pyrophosphatase [Steroidobacter sp.]|nr:CoA pyrophosphatase [Steroidobacteraceae bacterium]HLS82754.1 CoA pyrophosphatase [Steroidobacter sp.]